MGSSIRSLVAALEALDREQPGFLLDASWLASALAAAVIADASYMGALRAELHRLARDTGCQAVVGASEAAQFVVDGVTEAPDSGARVLVFEIAWVTGASFRRRTMELGTRAQVPASLAEAGIDGTGNRSCHQVGLPELARG
jgi:hypothetical protein